MTVTTEDNKEIFTHAHVCLTGIIRDGLDDKLLEFVKIHNEDAYKRLVVLITIFKAFPNNIKVQCNALTGKRLILNIPVVFLILKYTFASAEHVSQLMDEVFETKDDMSDGSYLMFCDTLKCINKFKDVIFSDMKFEVKV